MHPVLRCLVLLAVLFSVLPASAATALRPEVSEFVREMVEKHGYDEARLRALMSEIQPRSSIIRAMTRPGTARPWHEYRRRIVDPVRIDNGVRFWRENAPALERAAQEAGVPEELIVATIGIETLYGRNMGSFRVLDALATLAFDYPPRAAFFRGELEQFLLLSRELKVDPLNLKGSYAGAIGIPQFLPSSYRKYAVDFDRDGRIDLVNSAADAIGSIANYYKAFGWKPGAPAIVPAESGQAELAPLIAAGIKPHTSVGELRKSGVVVGQAIDSNAEAAVFFVQEEDGPRLLLGLNNFYVITRYNRSINYAMAVHDLAAEIRAARGRS